MLRPTEPRGNRLFVRFQLPQGLLSVQLGAHTTEILFGAFPYELLIPIELVPDVIKGSPPLVKSVLGEGENLPIPLHGQVQGGQLLTQAAEHSPKPLLALPEQGYVVGILRTVDTLDLVEIVHNRAQDEVSEVL